MATIFGTPSPDNLSALTPNPGDFILGLEGNDTITGGPGRDTLSGNEGNDLLISSGLGDYLLGGQGQDTLLGLAPTANDVIFGNKGADLIISSSLGDNAVYGGQDNDTIYSMGNDIVNGDFGDDIVYANGFSTIFGGGSGSTIGVSDGNDTLVGGIGNQILVGGTGNDIILFQPAIRKNISGMEVIEGGYGGADIVRNLTVGNVISFTGLNRGDVVELIAASGNPNASTGVFINFVGSAAGEVVTVENYSLNQLTATTSSFVRVNGTLINTNNLVPNSTRDILRFTV